MSSEKSIEKSVAYLNSDAAILSIKRDPYWPKWDSPLWHMLLLYEMNMAHLIPVSILNVLADAMNTHYIKFFPLYEHEIPEGINPVRHIVCHCQLGNLYQMLKTCKVDVDAKMPWMRSWFLKYQLPDGGLNCEEDAYTKSFKSSIASSLPAFEAILKCSDAGLTEDEIDFLDKGARYVIAHRLVHKTSGELMDADFLKLQFPNYYSYDILRGLRFLVKWKAYRHSHEADDVIQYGFDLIKEKLQNGKLKIERSDLVKVRTRAINEQGEWILLEKATRFELLDSVGQVGCESEFLTAQFEEIMKF